MGTRMLLTEKKYHQEVCLVCLSMELVLHNCVSWLSSLSEPLSPCLTLELEGHQEWTLDVKSKGDQEKAGSHKHEMGFREDGLKAVSVLVISDLGIQAILQKGGP